jgi:phosphopantothenoylcysteine decarboxylase/phosphopantothenate--cysteine ligase
MGFELAASAWRRGAEVVCIHGPVSVPPPFGPRNVEVENAVSMLDLLRSELDGSSVLCMAAAVSDFHVDQPANEKIKKEKLSDDSLTLELLACPDLLLETKDQRVADGVFTLGFALETTDGVSNATAKLESKNMNLVALNQAGAEDAGFEVDTNRVTLIDPSGSIEELPLLSKRETADRLLDRIEDRLRDGD